MAFSYLVALIISLPLAVLKHITLRSESPGSPGSPGSICLYEFGENVDVTEHWTWTTYVYFGESLVRFVPALVLATLNWLIMIKFRGVVKTRLQMHSTNQPSDLVSLQVLKQSTRWISSQVSVWVCVCVCLHSTVGNKHRRCTRDVTWSRSGSCLRC